MKRLLACLLLAAALVTNACALEVPTDTTIQNLNGSQQLIKTYTLPPGADPQQLIEEPFEQEGYRYTFAEIVKEENQVSDRKYPTGLLPEGCIAVVMEKKYVYYYIRYPELYTDFSYYETEYRDFPIPRLVFCFKYLRNEHKVAEVSLCVVKDERLMPDTPTYRYPFSNVHGNLSVCLGNNALPVYKDPARLYTLAAYILRMPNNDDLYSEQNNQLHAGFRDLLEQMKNKTPAHYYTDVLVKDGKTLKDFLTRR